jgi:hypothetical protein
MAGTFTGIILVMIGTGLLSDAYLARRGSPEGRAPTVGVFIGVYVGWILLSLAGAFYLQHLFGLDPRRGVLIVSGATCVVASSGHPWWLYETIRRVRWFGSIQERRDHALDHVRHWHLRHLGGALHRRDVITGLWRGVGVCGWGEAAAVVVSSAGGGWGRALVGRSRA